MRPAAGISPVPADLWHLWPGMDRPRAAREDGLGANAANSGSGRGTGWGRGLTRAAIGNPGSRFAGKIMLAPPANHCVLYSVCHYMAFTGRIHEPAHSHFTRLGRPFSVVPDRRFLAHIPRSDAHTPELQ